MDGKLEHGPRWVRWLVMAQRALCVGMVVTIAGLIFTQVVARYVFGSPFRWSEEVATFVFVWLGFVGGAFVMGEGNHIAVDVIGRLVGRRGRVIVECFSAVVAVVTAVVVVVAAVPYVQRMMAISSPAADIPRGLWIAAVAVGLGLVGLHAVVNAAVAIFRGDPIWAHNIGAEAEVGGLLSDASPPATPERDRERRS